ncbi:MAG: DciA family protein [Candidatus Uhrbacteria bacterium]|nr:DciA family protein [Candidatus Uhrbacteria bacterium]MDP3793707.1 DciA family protein [Candidatus Uhrbacteria bacterium]
MASFEPIRKILPQAIQQAGIARQVTAARVIQETQEALRRLWGEEKAKYIQTVSFKDGVIKVKALAPAAAQEIKNATVPLQNEVNRALGSKIVQQIQVVV